MGKLALAAIVSSWVVPITIMVNHAVPEPYMVRTHLLTSWTWTDTFWYLKWQWRTLPFIQYNWYLWSAGWDISYTTGSAVLQGKFWKLGPYDYHPSWPVCSVNSLPSPSPSLGHIWSY